MEIVMPPMEVVYECRNCMKMTIIPVRRAEDEKPYCRTPHCRDPQPERIGVAYEDNGQRLLHRINKQDETHNDDQTPDAGPKHDSESVDARA